MKQPERDAAYLWDMLESAKQTHALAADLTVELLLDDVRSRYAIERGLEIIGEAARRVSSTTQSEYPEIPWKGIIGFRNVLAHEYGAIDYERLYAVLEKGVPKLISDLQRIVDSIDVE